MSERLCGLRGDDVISGNEGFDAINGNQGDDRLNGNQGEDWVRGGAGDDVVRGGQDDDFVWGDDGDDQLWGDLGRDIYIGGAGNDTFHYRDGDGVDTVFGAGSNDRLVLHGIPSSLTLPFQEGDSCRVHVLTTSGGSITFEEFLCTDLQVLYADEECIPGKTTLCLQDGRFEVRVDFIDTVGVPGLAKVVDGVESPDSGLFWFFDPNNWEMLVKVVDGCDFNGHYWVFAAATTNVQFDMTVTDRTNGTTYEHSNPAGTLAQSVGDIEALATCP